MTLMDVSGVPVTFSMPNGDAVCQDALNCAPVESGEDVWG